MISLTVYKYVKNWNDSINMISWLLKFVEYLNI